MEYEMIQHDQIQGLRLLVDDIVYRTPHMHREFELILVLSNTLTITSHNERHLIRTGDIALLNPWQTHEFYTEDGVCTALFVQVLPDFFKNYFPSMPRLRFRNITFNASVEEQLRAVMISLALSYFSLDPLYEFTCARKLNMLFELVLKKAEWDILSSDEVRHESIVSRRMERIITYVNENCHRKLFLKEIAAAEDLSTSYLTHFIRDQLNMSFQDLLNLARLDMARKMIDSTDAPLIEICNACGFSDPRYLKKVFEERMNIPLHEYRQGGRRENSRAASANASSEHIYTDEEALQYLLSLS